MAVRRMFAVKNQRAGNARKPPPNRTHHEMTYGETDIRVTGINLPVLRKSSATESEHQQELVDILYISLYMLRDHWLMNSEL